MKTADFDGRGGGHDSSRSRREIQVSKVEAVRADWDLFVGHAGGDIVQTTMWAMSKLALGHAAFLVEARDSGGDLAGGALVVARHIGFGRRFGYVARGPVVPDRSAPQLIQQLLATLIDVARVHRMAGLVIQPMADDPASVHLNEIGFFDSPISVGPEATITVDLTRTEDEMLAAMTTMRRRNIRKAAQQDIEIDSSDDVGLFYRLHEASTRRQGYAALPMSYLQAQWDALVPHNAVSLLVARLAKRPVAALWLTRFAGTMVYRLPGWDPSATGSVRVNEALHWAAITRGRAEGAHTYDFGGFDRSAAEAILSGRNPSAGLEKTPSYFKLGFNPRPVVLPRTRMMLRMRPANWLARVASPYLAAGTLSQVVARRLRSG
jgi:lipid II:glycine glycyltransferase (peptidoglycan interpeptide bridge formation enzyme)